MVRRLGFDFEAGRLDASTHPFSGGVPEDVRMTTRYREDQFLPALMGTVHETGHGRYEQNRPRDWLGQPVSEARSMAIHESQSLSFEMQLGGHPGFAQVLSPMLGEAFGPQPAFEPGNLHRLLTRVQRGLIRVDADEVTYPAHVILRYEIERPLIEGQIEAEDVPALWDAKMAELLGLDTRGNFNDGPMQDVHWPESLFGYFPCYSLGAMYAAQWFAAMRRTVPDLDSAHCKRRLGAGLRLAARQHLVAGVALVDRRAGCSRQWRGLESGVLQGAPGGALSRLRSLPRLPPQAREEATASSRSFSTSSSRFSARAERVPGRRRAARPGGAPDRRARRHRSRTPWRASCAPSDERRERSNRGARW